MIVKNIAAGRKPPWDVNALIEVPLGGVPVKYELDKESGALYVDRFLHTAMFYPANYGFIPHTLADDGDPLDIMVVGPTPVVPGAIIRARPIGVLVMKDEKGQDEKVLAVPTDDLHPFHRNIESYRGLPQIMIEQIEHFFTHYKDLERGKWVEIAHWGEPGEAAKLIERTIKMAEEEDAAKQE